MNFKYMPELEWVWGYPVILGLMVIVAVVTLKLYIINQEKIPIGSSPAILFYEEKNHPYSKIFK